MLSSHKLQQNTTKNCHENSLMVRQLDQKYRALKTYLNHLKETQSSIHAEDHEAVIVHLTQELGKAALSELLSHYDVDSDVIGFTEQIYRRKHKAPKTYQTAFGSVSIERHVYVNRKKGGDGQSICPLELQAGVIEGYWSPLAAKQASWALAHLTAQEVEDLFFQFGTMNPSRSSLDRLPKILFNSWEPQTLHNHEALIAEESIPKEAVTVATSLDGVMVAMKPNKTTENKGKIVPCEWKEASCGTLSFFDKAGKRLSTIYYVLNQKSNKILKKNIPAAQ